MECKLNYPQHDMLQHELGRARDDGRLEGYDDTIELKVAVSCAHIRGYLDRILKERLESIGIDVDTVMEAYA